MQPPIPTPNETQPQFAVRFHEATKELIPSTEERNAQCLRYWRVHRGGADPLESKARDRFDQREFEHVQDIPVFAEHTTTRKRKDGTEHTDIYDRSALVNILDRCNSRILDTGDFAAVSDGHTPTQEERVEGMPVPDVLAYSGNYRLGMIGEDNPRWAILSDEYWQKGDVDRLRRLRRRSPEVWLEEKMADRFMDPIAALGSQAPRLDMGQVRYVRLDDGRLVEKYTAAGPSAVSVVVPAFGDDGDDDDDKTKYEGDQSMDQAVNPELVQQIVAAIMDTAPLRWVMDQMNADAPQPTLDDPNAAPQPQSAPLPPKEPEQNMKPYMSDDDMEVLDEDEKAEYECMDDGQKEAYAKAFNTARARFSKSSRNALRELRTENARILDDNKGLQQRVGAIESDKRKAERYAKLQDRRSQGFELDVDRELKRTAEFSDDQFEGHLDVITENYQRFPVAERVPMLLTPSLPHEDADALRHGEKGARLSKEAQRYCLREREKGNKIEYAEALEHVVASENEVHGSKA